MGVWHSIAQQKKAQPAPAGSGFPDLADLRRTLDRIDLDELVAALEGPPRTGRRVCPRRPILRAYLASYRLRIPSLSALIERLNNDPALRSVAGFTDRLPSYATFWRAFDRLADIAELITRTYQLLLDWLAELLPDLGREVAVDATVVKAYANPNRKHTKRNPDGPADPDASWTKKNSARSRSQQEWVFGYKAHAVADANHDVPLVITVTTGRRNDSPFMLPLLVDLASKHSWFRLGKGTVVIVDRGYDSGCHNEFVHRSGGVPVIHKRKLPGGELHDDIYTAEGVPTCIGEREMTYIRTDSDTGQHLYRCPEEGCARRDTARAVSACDDEAWENPEDNIRLFGGRIRRGSPEWKAMYAKRWSVERVFSRWKENGRLERHCYFGMRRVSAHIRLQMLVSLAAKLDQVLGKAAVV